MSREEGRARSANVWARGEARQHSHKLSCREPRGGISSQEKYLGVQARMEKGVPSSYSGERIVNRGKTHPWQPMSQATRLAHQPCKRDDAMTLDTRSIARFKKTKPTGAKNNEGPKQCPLSVLLSTYL